MRNKFKCSNCNNEDFTEFSLSWKAEKYYYIIDETNDALCVELQKDYDEDGFYECTCLICGSEVNLTKNLEFE